MELKLSDQQKKQLLQKVVSMYLDVFDEEISDFRAEQILAAFTENIAPAIYNMALEDTKQFLTKQIDDLDAIYHKEETSPT